MAEDRLFDISGIPEAPLRQGTKGDDTSAHPRRQVGEPLKMFMTAHEIMSEYQPLDADREDIEGSYQSGYSSVRPRRETSTYYRGDWAKKQYRFGMGEHSSQAPTAPPETDYNQRGLFHKNEYLNQHNESSPGPVTGPVYKPGTRRRELLEQKGMPTGAHGFTRMTPDPKERTTGGERVWGSSTLQRHGWQRDVRTTTDSDASYISHRSSGYSGSGGGVESDEELWQRKYEEGEERGLHEKIEESGGVRKPISLGLKKGSMGQRMIVGGHHRLAYMAEERPEDYVPVLHFKDIREAQSSHYFPYS